MWSSRTIRPRVPPAAALLALAACDPQVGPGYQGDALLTLAGTVSLEAAAPEDLSVVLRWVDFYTEPTELYAHSAGSRQGSLNEFPGRFTIELFEQPEPWLNDFSAGSTRPGESRIGLAELQASGGDLHAGGLHWYAYARQVLVYVASDVQAGTTSEKFVGAPLEAGFHVLEVVDAPCDSYLPDDDPLEGELDCLQPAADDLDSVVQLEVEGFADSHDPAQEWDLPRLYKYGS